MNSNLVDLASEAVVKDVNSLEDLENLEIPKTLFRAVFNKFQDAEWVASHRKYLIRVRKMENLVLKWMDGNNKESAGKRCEPKPGNFLARNATYKSRSLRKYFVSRSSGQRTAKLSKLMKSKRAIKRLKGKQKEKL